MLGVVFPANLTFLVRCAPFSPRQERREISTENGSSSAKIADNAYLLGVYSHVKSLFRTVMRRNSEPEKK